MSRSELFEHSLVSQDLLLGLLFESSKLFNLLAMNRPQVLQVSYLYHAL